MIRRTLFIALCFGLVRLGAAEGSTTGGYSLAKTLGAEDFARAGLNKLTPEELAFLEAVLARQQPPVPVAGKAAPSAAPAKTTGKRAAAAEKNASDFGGEQVAKITPANDGDELHTHIEGTIQEFSGRAVFALANGQVWQQRIPQDVFLSKKLVNPEVTLIRTSVGYKMLIDAANVVVFVKRIQ